MTKARVDWISDERGYGFLRLSDGTYAYAARGLITTEMIGVDLAVTVRKSGERTHVESVSPIGGPNQDLSSQVAE